MPPSFFNDPAPTELYPLSLHDALPICSPAACAIRWASTGPRQPANCGSPTMGARSEKDTSELQSQSNLACRLLFLMIRRPPSSTLFPYTTLFRSVRPRRAQYGGLRLVPGNRRTVVHRQWARDRKRTRLNSSHSQISHAAFFF